ncbi:MAG TPA: YncE family protein [Desulfuromonadaceae bacterium]|nr:YncE family protein [Desulfuromonadaceae bacterium]
MRIIAALVLSTALTGLAADFKWTGARIPAKASAGDGTIKLSTKIGTFLTPTNADEVEHVIANINQRFSASHPWATLAVGKFPGAIPITPEVTEQIFLRMDDRGVDVFIEIYPRKTDDVPSAIDELLKKYQQHKCVRGLCVDLEYYKPAADDLAKIWDEKIKSYNPVYRLALKHWEQNYMPPKYRGKGDLIFIDTSSEAPIDDLNKGFASWANHFAPVACAFQVGYPADEDAMNGTNTNGWWKLKDPVRDWANGILSNISTTNQELGFLWVCARSGKTYNTNWDLTRVSTPSSPERIEPLIAEPPVLVPNSTGSFDFLDVDPAQRRLLAAHTGNNSLDVFDLDTGNLVKHVASGKAQGEAVDVEGGKYYVSTSADQTVAVIDSKTLEKTGEIKLPGDADDILFNPANHCLYVDFDHGTNVWVIDTKTEKIIASIPIPETPEAIVYDPESKRIFQNIVSDVSVKVIDPTDNSVTASWPLAPAARPHGLAIDPKTQRLFSAGNNGRLIVLDATSGKQITTVDIAKGTDQIVFDPGNKRIYCGCGGGIISVVQETTDGATLFANVQTLGTGKTLTVDPKTHAVWTAYFDKTNCYVLKLNAAP